MNKFLFPFSLFILAIALGGCTDKPEDVLEKGPGYEPFDHFYFQRSYPDEKMDLAAFDQMSRRMQREYKEAAHSRTFDTEWQQEGPTNIGGRINCVGVHPENSSIILTGSATGGIYKTVDGGASWYPVGENMAFLALGAITYDPQNPDVVYAGTGDPNISGIPHIGDGVYKSVDGGETWTHIGLTEARIVSRIIVDPSNSDIVYASAMGLPFEPNEDRGLYKSTDAGETWEQVLFIDEGAGVIDLVQHPAQPETLYAASWDRIRNNTQSTVTGTNGKIWKSSDFGETWTMLSNGLPQDTVSRIGLAMSGSNPDKVFALYVGQNFQIQEIYRTNDGGQNWGPVPWDTDNMSNALGGFGWYFGQIRVNPWNDDEISVLGVDMWTTYNGGQSWEISVPPWWEYEVHADKHDMFYLDSLTVLLATDGGLYKSSDSFQSWEDIDDIPNTQFYRIGLNPHNPGVYTGGTQDNGTTTGNLDLIDDWNRDYGGDGFQPLYDPVNENLRYAETQNGGLVFNDGNSWQGFVSGIESSDRRNWDMPIIMSSFSSQRMYTGTYRVYRNGGAPYQDWEPISSDLTDGVIYGDRFHTISTVAESPIDPLVLYAGTTDGNVWVTVNGGDFWQNITEGLPERYVTNIKASPDQSNVVYVTHNGYKDNDFISHIHKSEDFGQTWIPISGDLENLPCNHIEIFDDENFAVATDFGVYATNNGGENWERIGNNMPFIPVFDIELDLSEGRLVAGTFARSIMTYPLDSVFISEEPVDIDEPISVSSIYPNPANDWIFADGQKGEFKVYSAKGELVLSGMMNDNSAIEVRTLDPGMYIIQFSANNGIFHFIKMTP